jgi:hypothetical protein
MPAGDPELGLLFFLAQIRQENLNLEELKMPTQAGAIEFRELSCWLGRSS